MLQGVMAEVLENVEVLRRQRLGAALGNLHVGAQNIAAVAMAAADNLRGRRVGHLNDHAAVDAAMEDFQRLLLIDLAADAVLDVVLRLLAQRDAGLQRVIARIGNARALWERRHWQGDTAILSNLSTMASKSS